jgi:peroxiredoxin Q/BCP
MAKKILIFKLLFSLIACSIVARSQDAASPKVGAMAPDFKLSYATRDHIFYYPREQISLSSQRGKNVILAFYHADWHIESLTELSSFRDMLPELLKSNTILLAISGDYVWSHRAFAERYEFQFPLLSDHDHRVAKIYNSFNGEEGLNKNTVFLIDRDGIVRFINPAFDVADDKAYAALRLELQKLK